MVLSMSSVLVISLSSSQVVPYVMLFSVRHGVLSPAEADITPTTSRV